eukprot:m.66941 g.66941  ORF g.66941 m.66941 type:complete len:462 (-) comp7646_c0_seq3:512-1897(-)
MRLHKTSAPAIPVASTCDAEWQHRLLHELAEDSDDQDAFCVVDLGDVYRKHQQWLRLLPRVEPFYAVKCNGDGLILDAMAALQLNFDCASKGEMEMILSRGVDPTRIIFAHPCKPISHVRYAAKHGVEMMTFDNDDELHKIKTHFPAAKLVLRILADDSRSICRLGTKFGAPVERATHLLKLAQSLHLNVVGVSFHVGSGCLDASAYTDACIAARRVFDEAEELGLKLTLLDVGGGFSGNDASGPVSFKDAATVLNAAIDQYFPMDMGVRIIAEPGRYYVHTAVTLATNIIAKRVIDGSASNEVSDSGAAAERTDSHDTAAQAGSQRTIMYYVNDGVYGSFNNLLYDHAEVFPQPLVQAAGGTDAASEVPCSIWGPTCDGLDCILKSWRLPELDIGDWLLFEDMGAYTFSAGSTFNGFPRPVCHYVFSSSESLDLGSLPESFPALEPERIARPALTVSSSS